MFFKLVLNSQTKVVDCGEEITLQNLHTQIKKAFPHLNNYTLSYKDEDNDQIILESQEDLEVFLENTTKKPKIYIQTADLHPPESQEIRNQSNSGQSKQVQQGEKLEEKEVEDVKNEQLKEEKIELIQEKSEKSQVKYEVKCNICGAYPITDVLFKCSVCSNYDLCAACQSTDTHEHPLIKLRSPEQQPLECNISFEKKEEIFNAISQLKSDIIVAETEGERRQMIVSYLGSCLGEQHFEEYKRFAKITKVNDYQELLKEYFAWKEKENKPDEIKKIIDWISNAKKNVVEFFVGNNKKE